MRMPGDKPEIIPAARMSGIAPFHVMDILARARAMEAEGRDIVHMEVGEPDFSTPAPIIEAGIRSLQMGKTHYTPALGLAELREAISRYYLDVYHVVIDAARIVVTPGASGALQLILGTLINSGEKVLMPDPGYPCNRHIVRLFDGQAVEIGVTAESGFIPSVQQVADAWDSQTRALMLASPSNPTGSLIDLPDLEKLYQFVRARGGALIVDEIYQGLVYGSRAETALKLGQEGLFIVNSFSKYFGMTGWRIGWVVAPEDFVDALDRLAQNIFLAAPTAAQYAALSAFSADTLAILDDRRKTFQHRRDYLYRALTGLGFSIAVKPQGAFYLYADVSSFTDDSSAFAEQLLEQAGVAITPGKDFGSYLPDAYVRFAYTTDMERLKEGVARIKVFLQGYG